MSAAANVDVVEAAQANYPAVEKGTAVDAEKPAAFTGDVSDVRASEDSLRGPNGEIYPTEEEVATLRRVHGKVDWLIYSIGIVEMVERFAYYGTTAVCEFGLILVVSEWMANQSQSSTSSPTIFPRALPPARLPMDSLVLLVWASRSPLRWPCSTPSGPTSCRFSVSLCRNLRWPRSS